MLDSFINCSCCPVVTSADSLCGPVLGRSTSGLLSPRCAGELSPTDSYVIPSWGGVVIYNPAVPAAAEQQEQPDTMVLTSEQLRGARCACTCHLKAGGYQSFERSTSLGCSQHQQA